MSTLIFEGFAGEEKILSDRVRNTTHAKSIDNRKQIHNNTALLIISAFLIIFFIKISRRRGIVNTKYAKDD